ncbi:monovalent cation/H+ antiporter subunit D [Altererythrobacter lauratis]|uniref:Monovalent cation/H+ antiporter subunit D n=1 Tax=Alteraurantiacibacter lauratis TaxID=2054627 RepID=A0ABV7ECU7_9SPHN
MNLILAPILLPAVIGAFLLLRTARLTRLGRYVSLGAMLVQLGIAVALFALAADGAIRTYAVGDWAAPFGIVLVLDRLSALMVLVTNILAAGVMLHAVLTDLDRRGWHFHPLFQFQLLGLCGAFLTGDLFNLFVFFEILLIASYGLMLHGQGSERLQAGVQYVVVNLVGSTVFLVAVGLLYGVTGTLNMADMAVRIANAPAEDQALLRTGAQVLIAVFALKAALLPLHLWLPRAYSSTSAPVAALFAILTKVGVYSILRTTTLMFGEDAGAAAWAPAGWMLPAALISLTIGFVGLVAARRLRGLAAFAVIGSTGTLLAAMALFTPASVAAALYYLPHSTFASAMLFLVADCVARSRGALDDRLEPGARFAGMGQLSLLFMLTAVALVGLPPLAGFIGKLMILSASAEASSALWIWLAILGTTFLAMIGFARAGSVLFWKSGGEPQGQLTAGTGATFPAWAIFAVLVALAALAGPATSFAQATADQLFAREAYIGAVLQPEPAPGSDRP